MARRSFLRQLVALPFACEASSWSQEASHKSLNIMMKSAWGSDDPTKAAFPFLHGLALSEAGHSVQLFLLGELLSYSVITRSAHSTSETKIVGLPNFAPHWSRSVCRTARARLQAPEA